MPGPVELPELAADDHRFDPVVAAPVAAAPAINLDDLFVSNDPLTRLADLFSSLIGRRLSSRALPAVAFLKMYGCADLVEFVMEHKRYQANPKDIRRMVEVVSPATAHKEMLQAQAKARKD